MAKRDRKCYLCGTNYKYCPTCSQDRMKPSWMVEFHEENCKNIFDICTKFNMGMLTKPEAQEALASCDLSNKVNFAPFVQRDIENIFAEDPKPAQTKPVTAKQPKSHEVVLPEDK